MQRLNHTTAGDQHVHTHTYSLWYRAGPFFAIFWRPFRILHVAKKGAARQWQHLSNVCVIAAQTNTSLHRNMLAYSVLLCYLQCVPKQLPINLTCLCLQAVTLPPNWSVAYAGHPQKSTPCFWQFESHPVSIWLPRIFLPTSLYTQSTIHHSSRVPTPNPDQYTIWPFWMLFFLQAGAPWNGPSLASNS